MAVVVCMRLQIPSMYRRLKAPDKTAPILNRSREWPQAAGLTPQSVLRQRLKGRRRRRRPWPDWRSLPTAFFCRSGARCSEGLMTNICSGTRVYARSLVNGARTLSWNMFAVILEARRAIIIIRKRDRDKQTTRRAACTASCSSVYNGLDLRVFKSS